MSANPPLLDIYYLLDCENTNTMNNDLGNWRLFWLIACCGWCGTVCHHWESFIDPVLEGNQYIHRITYNDATGLICVEWLSTKNGLYVTPKRVWQNICHTPTQPYHNIISSVEHPWLLYFVNLTTLARSCWISSPDQLKNKYEVLLDA